MKHPFKKSGVKSLLAVQTALALTLVSLPSCSGGGDSEDDVIVRDISPHELIPGEAQWSQLSIRGIHFANTGWEIGSDTEEDALPQDGMSVERQLTMDFYEGGGMDLHIPYANVVDNNDPPPREIDMTGGHWTQDTVSKQHNTLMYINFSIVGTIDANGAPCLYEGVNICVLLREGPQMNIMGGYRFDGSVMSGTLKMKADRTSFWGGDSTPRIYESVKNLWDQPCTYIVGPGWAPDDAN